MEYVFGTKGSAEILKTKGGQHTELSGFHEVIREYPDQTVIDNFRIVKKLDSGEDTEGNAYDWYEIDRHNRIIDKSKPLTQRIDESVSALEDALCGIDENNSERFAAIEDALCDIDIGG